MYDKNSSLKACKVCKGNDIKFHFNVNNQNLWKCKICKFTFVEKKPTLSQLDKIYSETYFRNSKYGSYNLAMLKENQRRQKLLKSWAKNGAHVLDVGCSTGDFIRHVKDEYLTYGIDYSEFAIKEAIKKNPELADNLKFGSIEKTDLGNRLFDIICLWDVIEHIWDPVKVISDLFSRLKPGGGLMISTPAIDSFNARLLGRYWPFMTPPEHLSFLSRETFYKIASNLEECELVYFSRKGKWANLSFIAYKISRVSPGWFPIKILSPFFKWPLRLISMYVPSGDIAYVVLKKSK